MSTVPRSVGYYYRRPVVRARLFTQGPLEIALHKAALGPIDRGATDRHRAGNLLIAAARIGRQQDLRALQLAGGMLAPAQHRGELVAFRLAQFDPVTYIHLGLLLGSPDESSDESKIRQPPPPRRAKLHRKARPVPGLHLHVRMHVPTPTRRDR